MDFGYNRRVYRVYFFVTIFVAVICSGCIASPANSTATPDFVTAVLPFTPPPTPTQPPIESQPTAAPAENPTPTFIPIEGTTTSQLNVRAEPSTASASLGLIELFAKVLVNGKDASGSWYRIEHAGRNGWVRAEFVQVDATAQIPVLGAGAGSGSAGSALVTQGINVRNGPAVSFDSLGVLNPKDVVFLSGRDASGAWIQIEFASSPDGKGWVAAEFLQADGFDALPVVAGEVTTAEAPPEATASVRTAPEDGDSMQAPLTLISLSSANARAAQIAGNVSSMGGDAKDWIHFSAESGLVLVEAQCAGSALQVEVWNGEILADTFTLACGGSRSLNITPNNWHFLSLSLPDASEPLYMDYILKLEQQR